MFTASLNSYKTAQTRQLDAEYTPLTRRALHKYLTAVRLGNALDNRQTQAAALGAMICTAIKAIKDMRLVCLDYANAGAGDRHWGTKNLLLEFDEKGLVKKSEIFSDKDLIRELGPVVEDYKVAESADRMEIMVAPSYLESASSRIILSGGSIEFDGVGPRKRGRHFTIPASKVSRIESVNARGADPLYTAQVIHFSENLKTFGGPPRNKIFVRIKMPDLVALLQYVKTNGGH